MKVHPCKHCGSVTHSTVKCFKYPHKPIDPISAKNKKSKAAMMSVWFRLNHPNENEEWTCYLQISPNCPKKITIEYLTLEHVIPKVKAPELRFDHTNIRPSCGPCNKLKGSRTIEQLSIQYPHLKVLI